MLYKERTHDLLINGYASIQLTSPKYFYAINYW